MNGEKITAKATTIWMDEELLEMEMFDRMREKGLL